MNYIIELLQVSLTILFVTVLILNKRSKLFIFVYSVAIIFSCSIAFITSYNSFVMPIIYIILYFLLPLIISMADRKSALYISLFTVCLISTVNSLVNLVLCYFSNSQNGNMSSAVIVTSILYFLTYIVLLSNKKIILAITKFFKISALINFLVILFLGLFFVLLLFESFALVLLPNEKLIFAISFSTVFLMLGCILTIIFLAISNYKKIYYEKTSYILNKDLETQAKHYENTLRMYDNLRTFKHDFNNLKIGLTSLLNENKIEEALKYLNDFNADSKYNQPIKTGNSITDAIIANKYSELQYNNIDISFNGIIPYDALEVSDLCVSFGNALDNAIEACANMKTKTKKTISVNVKQANNLLLIKIINPVSHKVEIINNTITTSKGDSFSHGIGLYSIKETVKKYDGFYNINCSDEEFILEIGFFLGIHTTMQ